MQLYQICRFWDNNGTSQIGKITFFGDVSTEHLEFKTDVAKTDLFFCLFYRESVIEEVSHSSLSGDDDLLLNEGLYVDIAFQGVLILNGVFQINTYLYLEFCDIRLVII